jgi:DNA repair protein RAD16
MHANITTGRKAGKSNSAAKRNSRGANQGDSGFGHDTAANGSDEAALAASSGSDLSDGSDSDSMEDFWSGTNQDDVKRKLRERVAKKPNKRHLDYFHPELPQAWVELDENPPLNAGRASQPTNISRELKPFQLEGLAWMVAMEKTKWKGGLLADEMGLGKTIQAVSLIMSDFPATCPTLVLAPPVALFQWVSEIERFTDGTLKTFLFHGTNSKSKHMTPKTLRKYHVIIMSYNSLESMYRKQEKGFKRKDGQHIEQSLMHQVHFHRVILDEAHCIKV